MQNMQNMQVMNNKQNMKNIQNIKTLKSMQIGEGSQCLGLYVLFTFYCGIKLIILASNSIKTDLDS